MDFEIWKIVRFGTPMKTRIICFFGTSAEIIKLASVLHEINKSMETILISFDQQQKDVTNFTNFFNLSISKRISYNSEFYLSGLISILIWLAKIFFFTVKNIFFFLEVYRHKNHYISIVQGDTMSAVLGALLSKILRIRVCHIEAGLRSFSLLHPFPEEINRRLISKFADYHFAPSLSATQNLSKSSLDTSNIIYTHGNTVQDSLFYIAEKLSLIRKSEHLLVSIHRQEFLRNKKLYLHMISRLIDISHYHKVILVSDKFTIYTMKKYNIYNLVNDSNIQLKEKLSYIDFIKIIFCSKAVITDSGGLQEEAALLRIPTLIHRKFTERDDGLDDTIRLSFWNMENLDNFVNSNLKNTVQVEEFCKSTYSPSSYIVKTIMNFDV